MIAFDNHSSGDTGVGATSLTYSHTTAGLNRILWVSVFLYQGGPDTTGDTVTGVTYNGVAMTQVKKSLQTGGTYNRYAYLYMLVAPATGANNIVVSNSDVANRVISYSSSYTGALQTGQPDASTTNTADIGSSSLATALVTVANNCWMVSTCICSSQTISSTTNATIRDNAQFTGAIADSNVALPVGSYTITWTAGGSTEFNVLQASFAPAPTGGFLDLTSKSW